MYFLLTVQKVAPLAFLNLRYEVFRDCLGPGIMVLGALTAVVGGFIGNNQTDLRAILGCSSVVHGG